MANYANFTNDLVEHKLDINQIKKAISEGKFDTPDKTQQEFKEMGYTVTNDEAKSISDNRQDLLKAMDAPPPHYGPPQSS